MTFRRPFLLPGFSAAHAAGTFEVHTDEERLDTVHEAWRRVATMILLVDRGLTEVWTVLPDDLIRAMALDAAPAGG